MVTDKNAGVAVAPAMPTPASANGNSGDSGAQNPSPGRRKLRRKAPDLVLWIAFFVGLGVLLYPPLSNFYNSFKQAKAIAVYNESLDSFTPEDYAAMWSEVDAYNKELSQRGTMNFHLSKDELQTYNSILDPAGIGVMGHIEIPDIGVDLPIYHTVEDSVLQLGVGHIPGSSLPGGGESTHSVLSGHRGLPTSKLFTNLDQLREGDYFMIHVLDRHLAYQVDQIRIVKPDEVDDLAIVPGKDYVTLVTCTPYAINTHRLLVRGHQVPYVPGGYVPADAVKMDPVLVSSIMAVPLFVIAAISAIAYNRRKAHSRRDML